MQVVTSGSIVTYTSGGSGSLPPITLTTGNPEAARLREVLLGLRPEDGVHDHLCDSQPGDPDQWIDESNSMPICAEGWRAFKWEPDMGLVDDGPATPPEPYVGWCCGQARMRQGIDAALKT